MERALAPHARIYVVLVVIAGYLALGQMFVRSGPPPLAKLIVLLLLAVTCGPLQIRMKRILSSRPESPESDSAGVSIALVFVFAALVELPVRYAAVVSMAAVASQLRFSARSSLKIMDWLFHLSAANLSLLLAYEVDHALHTQPALGRLGALMVAALIFFLTSSWTRAAALSLPTDSSVIRTWGREFLPDAPLYGVMAAGGYALTLLFDPTYLHTFVLAFPVLCLFYYCYEFYFGRLSVDRLRAKELTEIYRRTVEALALAMEAKDRATSGHLRRVERYAVAVARRMGCSSAEIKALEAGALLHDIGKLAVPEHLLFKPAKLTRQEFNQIAIHPQVGAEILSTVNFPFPVAELVHCHHENWDGSGYPRGLKGTEIPLTARILSVADCFDALISDRPYRPAFSVDRAVEMIRSRGGTTFDPQVVEALLETLPQVGIETEQGDHQVRNGPSLRSPRAIEAVQTSLVAEERGAEHAADVRLPEGEALRRVYESVNAGLYVDEVLEAALSELGQVAPYDACAVFLLDGNALACRHRSWFEPSGLGSLEVPVHEGPTGWVAARGETLVNGNPSAEHGHLGSTARRRRWKEALIVPLWSAGTVVGTLNLYSQDANAYTPDHARYAELITANLGIALVRAIAWEKSSIDALPALPAGASVH